MGPNEELVQRVFLAVNRSLMRLHDTKNFHGRGT
jgi:hypothetical protein